MPELITLYKQDGTKVHVNKNSLGAAIALGWLDKNPKEEKKQEVKNKSKK